MKRLAWFSAVALATGTCVLVLWEFRTAVLMFILSLALAATVRPLVVKLQARGMSPGIALVMPYVLGMAAVAGVLLFVSGPLVNELQQIMRDLSLSYGQIERGWPEGTALQQALAQQLPPSVDLYDAIMGPQGSALAQTFLGVTISSIDFASQIVLVIVMSAYWAADQSRFKRLWLSLLPAATRERMRGLWTALEADVGAYIRSALAQSVLAVAILVPVYHVIGVPYPLLLALAVSFANLIPWLGFPIGILLAFGLGAGQALTISLAAAGVTLIVLAWLEFAVEPAFFHRERYSSLLVIVLALVLFDLMGLLGIILAPPLAVAVQIIARPFQKPAPAAIPQVEIDQLAQRLSRLHELTANIPAEARPPLESLLARLDDLLASASTHKLTANEREAEAAGDTAPVAHVQPGSYAQDPSPG